LGQQFDQVIHWRRPQEFMITDAAHGMHKEIKVFLKEVEPNDIKPGPHSYRWILCALASLAERPDLVEKLFVTREFKQNGAYRLQINKNGVWNQVTVDDYFPCSLEGPPLFTRTHGNELWVLLLEKAYAKLHGGFHMITHGHPNEALQDFTGLPTVCFDFADEEVKSMIHSGDIFRMMQHYQEQGFLMTASAPGNIMMGGNLHPRETENQLLPGHTYTVVQVREVYNHKLINIRNVWGKFDWDGAWNRRSAFWTHDIIDKLKPKLEEDDGTFWMCYDDFIRYFSGLNVCKTKSMNEVRVKGKFVRVMEEGKPTDLVTSKWFYCLSASKPTNLHLGIHQIDEKQQLVLPRRGYLDAGFAILRLEAEGSKLEHY